MNKISTSLFSFFLSIYCVDLPSQFVRYDVGVQVAGNELTMPWTGGMNAPQFANIDLIRDGITDMISFDRQGDILRTYVHLPASGRWVQQWEFESVFPPVVDWIRIVDFNKDGVEDIFTSASPDGVPGIRVYIGSYQNETWSFELFEDRGRNYLQVPAGQFLTNLYVSWDDIPAILDVDNDGDMDVLSFEPGGSFIAYFKNQSVEMGWGLDSLRFEVADFCWGKILENELTEEVYLSDDPDMCSDGGIILEEPIIARHAGSTISALDVDFDGDKDAWVGDITSRHIVFLLNGLNTEEAWITSQEAFFPAGDVPIDIPYFVATYFVELDDDPEPELLAAVNSRTLAEDRESVWRYDDDLADGPLNFQLNEKGWLQNQMIDGGSHSRPAFADVNGDGLKDMVMGGYHFTEGSQTRLPSLWLYKNIGTPQTPYFQFLTSDYLAMSQFGTVPTFDFAPVFGDLDGDGSDDLIVGDQNGKLFYYHNDAPPGDSMIFDEPVYPYMNINVGVSATPQIADINGDGLSDLIIGERTGNADVNGRCSIFNYFQNQGTIGNPFFEADVNVAPNTGCYGRILFDIPIGLPQYSTPFIFRTMDGLFMVSGDDYGKLHLYTDLAAGIGGSLTVIDDNFGGLDFGNRSAPALADLNNDGKYELIAGNQRGGLELLSTDLEVGTTSISGPAEEDKPYFISETEGTIQISWSGNAGHARLMDLQGRILREKSNEKVQQIDVSVVPPGIYFVQLVLGGRVWVEKVLIM